MRNMNKPTGELVSFASSGMAHPYWTSPNQKLREECWDLFCMAGRQERKFQKAIAKRQQESLKLMGRVAGRILPAINP